MMYVHTHTHTHSARLTKNSTGGANSAKYRTCVILLNKIQIEIVVNNMNTRTCSITL